MKLQLPSKPKKKSTMTVIILYESLVTSEAVGYLWMDVLIDVYENLLHKILTKLTKIK